MDASVSIPKTSADEFHRVRSAQLPVRRGDIRRVEPLFGLEAEPRDVLVLSTTRSVLEYAEIMLAHDNRAMGLPTDISLNLVGCDIPRSITLHTPLRGVVWTRQLTTLIGHISRQEVKNLERMGLTYDEDPTDAKTEATVPQCSELQSDFLREELDALWALTGDCTDAILDDGEPWQVDTEVLTPQWMASSESKYALCAELHHLLYTRRTTASSTDLVALVEAGTLDLEQWETAFPYLELGPAMVNSIFHLLSSALRETTPSEPSTDGTEHSKELPARRDDTRPLYLRQSARLITAPSLWNQDINTLLDYIDSLSALKGVGYEIMMLATPDRPISIDQSRSRDCRSEHK